MKAKLVMLALAACTLLAGCAAPRPLVDPGRTDMNAYERDLRECQALSGELPGAAASGAVGAGAGALLGAVLCRTLGGRDCGGVARATALAGGVSGAASGAREESYTVKQCLRGRGYNPLN